MSVSFPKPLTEKEEKFYIKQYEQGDLQARHILIERNLRLVAHVAKKYATQPQMLEEYISIGTIGLIKAVNTYRTLHRKRNPDEHTCIAQIHIRSVSQCSHRHG